MISKTKLSKRITNKNDIEVVDTLKACKKNAAWMNVGRLLSRSRSQYPQINLDIIDRSTKEGDRVVIPGKVLGSGQINKKIRVIALKFSGSAKEKLKSQKVEVVSILEEIKSNPKAEGITVMKE
jgi:large subunit ribosomal protein L18e